MLELKTKSNAVEAHMQLQLNTAETAAYNGIEEALRLRITREIKQKSQALTFNVISGFHLIARFKAEIRASLMKKEGQLTSIAMIKAEAMQLELILEENKKKSTIGTNGNHNGNGKQTVLINELEKEEVEDVNALYQGKRNGYKGQSYNPNYQNSRTTPNNSNKTTFCHKPGHQINKGFLKIPSLKNQSGQRQNNTRPKESSQRKYCTFCEKDGHIEIC
jgi:hypothetical protein